MAKGRGKKMVLRRKRRRVGKRRRANVTLVRGPSIIADETYVKLTYSQTVSLAMVAGSNATYVFRGNSIFDPDYSGTGAQPLGHDQYNAFYQRYQVMGCKIQVDFAPRASPPTPCGLQLSVTPTDLVVSGAARLDELPYSKSRILTAYSGTPARISNYMSTKAKFGYKDIKQEHSLQAQFGANPAEAWYWIVSGYPMDASGTATVDAKCKLTYYVRLFDREDLNRS